METQELISVDLLCVCGPAEAGCANPVFRTGFIPALCSRTHSPMRSVMVTWTGGLQLGHSSLGRKIHGKLL